MVPSRVFSSFYNLGEGSTEIVTDLCLQMTVKQTDAILGANHMY